MFKYRGFGLNILSEIAFREFAESDFSGEADLKILLGATPVALEGDDVVKRARVEFRRSEYLLKVHDVANYYVKGGREAIIEPFENSDPDSVRLFFLSSGIAAALHQQGRIPLHASGVHTKDGVVLFIGESGAGKSTTISLLQQHGYRIFTDDVCVIDNSDLGEGRISVFPSYPVVKLWSNTIEELSVDTNSLEHFRLRKHIPKVGIVTDDIGTDKFEVSKIIIIKKENHAIAVHIDQLHGIDVFRQLQKQTYRRNQVDPMGIRQEHFQAVSAICSKVPVFTMIRPTVGNTFSEVVNCLNRFLND